MMRLRNCFSSSAEDFELVGFVLDEYGEKVLPLEAIIRGISKGTVMYKVKGPRKWYRRKYRVDLKKLQLWYSPSHKIFQDTNVVNMNEVEEVRKGWTSDVFNRLEETFRNSRFRSALHPDLMAALSKDNCFTVVTRSGGTHKIIDLIAPNSYTRDAWVRGLRHILAICKSFKKNEEYNRWLREQVEKADVNNNGSLSFNECLILLNQLNICMDKRDVRKIFNIANFKKNKIDGEDALEPTEFVYFYHSLTRRPEIAYLMEENTVNHTTIMSPEELQRFLKKTQKMEITPEECRKLIEQYEQEESRVDESLQQCVIPGYLTLKGFQNMLLSADNDIFNKKHRNIYQDMTQPLHNYYISTSHNTYLLSGQLIGSSSVEGYIDALNRGCRCLELDTWDGQDGEPIVFHGYTLTTRIYLRDILDAIKIYAFKASPYPVILSIENHCSLIYQRKMVTYFKEILGEYLWTDPIEEDETTYPSPEQLTRKILIKAKKIEKGVDIPLLEEEIEQEQVMAAVSKAQPGELVNPVEEVPRKTGAVDTELSDVVNYFTAVRFSSFEECQNWSFNKMASFQETTALRLAMEHEEDFIAYNCKHFSRIYPKGTRTDSSNYDPLPYWNVGCQMVALNFQTSDKFLGLYNSKFMDNGRCGYVLKPKYLRESTELDSNRASRKSTPKQIILKILTGQQIPKPNRATEGEVVDPYVVIKITGHANDAHKKKTAFILNNGFNPSWNETFKILLKFPELAVFHFVVKDQNNTGKNELLGKFSLPFTSITEGYRHIHLEDTQGKKLVPASLFVHISIETPAPDSRKSRRSSAFT